MLSREDLLGRRAREELETALGITYMANTDDPKNRMEAIHQDIA
jgi:hypothetical protein